jgi:hypothetical protein
VLFFFCFFTFFVLFRYPLETRSVFDRIRVALNFFRLQLLKLRENTNTFVSGIFSDVKNLIVVFSVALCCVGPQMAKLTSTLPPNYRLALILLF